jgi:hypothetical protein
VQAPCVPVLTNHLLCCFAASCYFARCRYPQKDKSCPFVIKSTEFAANTTNYSFDWPIPKNMTKATWFTSVLVQCTNGTGTSFCQHDSTVNQTYFATNIINSTPTGMVVATAVCSAIGPLFLGVYFLRDMLMTRKGSS